MGLKPIFSEPWRIPGQSNQLTRTHFIIFAIGCYLIYFLRYPILVLAFFNLLLVVTAGKTLLPWVWLLWALGALLLGYVLSFGTIVVLWLEDKYTRE